MLMLNGQSWTGCSEDCSEVGFFQRWHQDWFDSADIKNWKIQAETQRQLLHMQYYCGSGKLQKFCVIQTSTRLMPSMILSTCHFSYWEHQTNQWILWEYCETSVFFLPVCCRFSGNASIPSIKWKRRITGILVWWSWISVRWRTCLCLSNVFYNEDGVHLVKWVVLNFRS